MVATVTVSVGIGQSIGFDVYGRIDHCMITNKVAYGVSVDLIRTDEDGTFSLMGKRMYINAGSTCKLALGTDYSLSPFYLPENSALLLQYSDFRMRHSSRPDEVVLSYEIVVRNRNV